MQKLIDVKCKCGQTFQTAAPSRIADALCTECIRKESINCRNKIPPNLHEVFVQIRNTFGACPGCGNPLIPLGSFKVGIDMVCHGCYRKKMNAIYRKKGAECDLLE